MYTEVLGLERESWGDTHNDTLNSIERLARVLQAQGDMEEAETLLTEVQCGLCHFINFGPNKIYENIGPNMCQRCYISFG